MKTIIIITTIPLVIFAAFKVASITPKVAQDPYELAISQIMHEESFVKSVRIQAEMVKANRDKGEIEKRLEGLRKQELTLASTSKAFLK